MWVHIEFRPILEVLDPPDTVLRTLGHVIHTQCTHSRPKKMEVSASLTLITRSSVAFYL